jgi:hypothetical protein
MSEDIIVQVGKTIRFDYFLPDVRKNYTSNINI